MADDVGHATVAQTAVATSSPTSTVRSSLFTYLSPANTRAPVAEKPRGDLTAAS